MSLTEFAVRGARPRNRPYKLVDGGGLYILVTEQGHRYWRLNYRHDGKQKTLALGVYPMVGLADARAKRDTARLHISEGIDPSASTRQAKETVRVASQSSFRAVAEEWLAKIAREGKADVTLSKIRWLLAQAYPVIGERPIADIKAIDVLAALRPIEGHGKYESARRLRSVCSRVFRYGIATSRCERDVAVDLRGALITPQVKHLALITCPHKFGALLRAIDGFDGHPVTCIALKLTPHVFVRPGELRRAEWAEFDLEKSIWTIPGSKMKMRLPLAVPLSSQVLELLDQLEPLTGMGRYLFPTLQAADRPMSENTINGALRRMGFAREEMTAHGFRTTASTLLNEMGRWHPDAIERQLAHADANSVRRVYARGEYWKERVAMMQAWSDYMDGLKRDLLNSGI